MTRIAATVRDGLIVPLEPLDWPDGTEVDVSPAAERTDDDRPETPEEIAAWLAEFRSLPPLAMTPEEEAAWSADRKAQREYDRAMTPAREERLRESLQ